MSDDFDTERMRRLQESLENADELFLDACESAIGETMLLFVGDAKNLCPVDTGQLRGSITPKVERDEDGVTGTFGTNVEYAPYVEFGTGQRGEASASPPKAPVDLAYRHDWSGQPALPFLYPAFTQNKKKLRDAVIAKVAEALRGLGDDLDG